MERAEGVERENFRSVLDVEGCEVATDEGGSGDMVLDKDDFDGAAAYSFDADSARAGKNVEEARAAHVRAEYVEEGFAQAVASRAERIAFETFQDAAAIFSGNNAHFLLADLRKMITPLPFSGEHPQYALQP